MTQQAIKRYLKKLPRKQTNSLFRMKRSFIDFVDFLISKNYIKIISNIFHLISSLLYLSEISFYKYQISKLFHFLLFFLFNNSRFLLFSFFVSKQDRVSFNWYFYKDFSISNYKLFNQMCCTNSHKYFKIDFLCMFILFFLQIKRYIYIVLQLQYFLNKNLSFSCMEFS